MQQSVGNTRFLLGELNPLEELGRILYRHGADFADVLSRDPNLPSFHSKAVAIAFSAAGVSAITAQKNAHMYFVLFPFQMPEEPAHARELLFSIDDLPLLLGTEFGPGHIEWNSR